MPKKKVEKKSAKTLYLSESEASDDDFNDIITFSLPKDDLQKLPVVSESNAQVKSDDIAYESMEDEGNADASDVLMLSRASSYTGTQDSKASTVALVASPKSTGSSTSSILAQAGQIIASTKNSDPVKQSKTVLPAKEKTKAKEKPAKKEKVTKKKEKNPASSKENVERVDSIKETAEQDKATNSEITVIDIDTEKVKETKTENARADGIIDGAALSSEHENDNNKKRSAETVQDVKKKKVAAAKVPAKSSNGNGMSPQSYIGSSVKLVGGAKPRLRVGLGRSAVSLHKPAMAAK